MKTVQLLFLFCVFYTMNTDNSEKRFLVSDPNYVVVEVKMQELTNKVDMVTSEYANQIQNLTMKLSDMEAQNAALTSGLLAQKTQISILAAKLNTSGSGGMYVRWGRTTCPNSSDLVYAGYSGGSDAGSPGGAAEYICLPPHPQYEADALSGASGGNVYEAEYIRTFFSKATVHDDVPCSVCRSGTKSSILMIPGRNQCVDGWSHEYNGYLASGHYTNEAATQYVCLDTDMEAILGGRAAQGGKYFEYVTSRCGSLPCPPYTDNKTMSCIVCSK